MPKTPENVPSAGPPAQPASGVGTHVGNYRWTICALLFVATTINYIDRNIIGILKEDVLIKQLGWTEADYGDVVFYFQMAYAFMMIAARIFLERRWIGEILRPGEDGLLFADNGQEGVLDQVDMVQPFLQDAVVQSRRPALEGAPMLRVGPLLVQ